MGDFFRAGANPQPGGYRHLIFYPSPWDKDANSGNTEDDWVMLVASEAAWLTGQTEGPPKIGEGAASPIFCCKGRLIESIISRDSLNIIS
jgi:hypothetical protein